MIVKARNDMATVADFVSWLETLAPLVLSEDWDNTGLLLGDPQAGVERVQTCLTLTPASVAEAVDRRADLVISHHPLPFKPLSRITTQTIPGKLIWRLACHGIAVYAPHTAWDSARSGINALLAEKLQLDQVAPILPLQNPDYPGLGSGRIGILDRPYDLREIAGRLRQSVPYCRPRGVDSDRPISRVAICCGSGGSLLGEALRQGCDLFLTGEATFHQCLEAEAAEKSLLMIGHFASERFAMEHLAQLLASEMPGVGVWASESEQDPIVDL